MRSYWTISPRSRDFLFVPHRQVFWSCGQPQGFGILAETARGPRAGNAGWGGGRKSVSGAARRRSAGAELPAKREASTPRYRCGHRRSIEKRRSLKERLAIGIIHSADCDAAAHGLSHFCGGTGADLAQNQSVAGREWQPTYPARRSTMICCRSTRTSASSAVRDRNRSRTRLKISLMRSAIRPSVARFCAPRQPNSIYDSDRTLETGLAGWACRIRTSESVREPPYWICVTISPAAGASPAAETRRV